MGGWPKARGLSSLPCGPPDMAASSEQARTPERKRAGNTEITIPCSQTSEVKSHHRCHFPLLEAITRSAPHSGRGHKRVWMLRGNNHQAPLKSYLSHTLRPHKNPAETQHLPGFGEACLREGTETQGSEGPWPGLSVLHGEPPAWHPHLCLSHGPTLQAAGACVPQQACLGEQSMA